jgi:hypothetical protein
MVVAFLVGAFYLGAPGFDLYFGVLLATIFAVLVSAAFRAHE